MTGRRGAAVPVEVGPARGQPDQPRGAGEWGSYPGGELGVGVVCMLGYDTDMMTVEYCRSFR